ncbi:hypothetical protein ACFCYM_34630 [Streptomyces sp. NPDC056254]|uniref:hypothetical protein n=1 Tax=Streptomyces sp. NPDC056254 TaxID=3345763 RepID=UPI0035DDFDEF
MEQFRVRGWMSLKCRELEDVLGWNELTPFSVQDAAVRAVARRALASFAVDAADLVRLLDMLDLWPDQDPSTQDDP